MTSLTTIIFYHENATVNSGSFVSSSLSDVFEELEELFGNKIRYRKIGDEFTIESHEDVPAEDHIVLQPISLGKFEHNPEDIQDIFLKTLHAVYGEDCVEQDIAKILVVEGEHDLKGQGSDWSGCREVFAV
ncbi:hypothetical protein [Achromobacter sp.]|uniref:hypothetical protein n=1 Tax=Achromobacter sp. TaxID=134375 RepID=UPI002589840A|nr:hypothetical protein [Achromobacter sp.]